VITIYEEEREGAIAITIEHPHATMEKCLEVIGRMDGFTRSQVTVQHKDHMIMIGGGIDEFIVTVETGCDSQSARLRGRG